LKWSVKIGVDNSHGNSAHATNRAIFAQPLSSLALNRIYEIGSTPVPLPIQARFGKCAFAWASAMFWLCSGAARRDAMKAKPSGQVREEDRLGPNR
jgi:hypothetical protein